MIFTVDEVVDATGGRVVPGSAGGRQDPDVGDTRIDRFTQDSREAAPGTLFVPLVGERDGHRFIADAVRAGACAFLTSRRGDMSDSGATPHPAGGGVGDGAVAIAVEDTQAALSALGRHARGRLGGVPVVGVTGSVGKTTTKDLIAGVLGRAMRVHASERSFNNEIGVPLTLLAAPESARAVVLELASRGVGHIRELCELARPTMGVVTTVDLVHASEFGSLSAVVRAKRELVESLPAANDGGVAFLNADVPEVAGMANSTVARVVTYGETGEKGSGAPANVTAHEVRLDDQLRAHFTLESRLGQAPGEDGVAGDSGTSVEIEVVLGARGRHAVSNALAAAAVGLTLGVPLSEVAEALAAPMLSPLRMELLRTPSGTRVINDCYNASPPSMRAALDSLAALDASPRVAVLGVMAELGDFEASEHAKIAEYAKSRGITVIAVDAPLYAAGDHPLSGIEGAPPLVEVSGINAALKELRAMDALQPSAAVLVKGSRVAGLEHLTTQLMS